jgi:hypothetical protein
VETRAFVFAQGNCANVTIAILCQWSVCYAPSIVLAAALDFSLLIFLQNLMLPLLIHNKVLISAC